MSLVPSDFLSPSIYADGIPHFELGELRRESPVVWVEEPVTATFAGGRGFWLVLNHADVSHVSRHPEDFSSSRGTSFLRDQRPRDVAALRRMMLNMDPPEHSSLRKIVNRAFTPQSIRRQLSDAITRHAKGVVDAVAEAGSIDFLGSVAAEMPLLVLADVLGIPAEDRSLLYSWTNRLVGLDDPEYGGDPQAFVSAFTEMFAYAREVTRERRARPTDDLWSTVANAEVDGEMLTPDDLDRFFQLLVIAGNDTTRNLIANTMLTLSRHPDQFRLLRQDHSLLPGTIEEVLRFSPSVIQFRRTATRDLVLGGQQIAEDDKVIINYASANRDETVFADPDRFDIKRDPNPHISFGDGTHYCLGANLARLQTRVLLTELFERLPDIEVSGEPTRMQSSFMNGIRHLPVEFTPERRQAPRPTAILTPGPTPPAGCPAGTGTPAPGPTPPAGCPAATGTPATETPTTGTPGTETPAVVDAAAAEASSRAHGTPLLILFGSNFGTAEDVALDLAEAGRERGFEVSVASLDEAVDLLPTAGAVLVTTATYNGTPPDNAVDFAQWIGEKTPDLSGVRFAVFGCGNHEWAATFQDFPRFVDDRLHAFGASRFHWRGEGDAAEDFDGALAAWEQELWPRLAEEFGLNLAADAPALSEPDLQIEFLPADRPSPFVRSLGAQPMRVLDTRLLTRAQNTVDVRPVRHIDLELPMDVTYQAGDHLGVIPHNSSALVDRVTKRFGLDPESWIRLTATNRPSFLPVGERLTVGQLLTDYVELQDLASRRDIERLLQHTEYPWSRERLEKLLDTQTYRAEVLDRRLSVMDLLEEHPTSRLPFTAFLELLRPLAPRYYSIASSPAVQPSACSITVGALAAPARSGHGTFAGTSSNYLFEQGTDRVIHAFVRDTASPFRLPADPSTPLLMIASGTGIAPFRGFLQERAAARAAGTVLGPALLVYGCRHPQSDLLYGNELEELAMAAGTDLAYAYSRVEGLPRIYVQDRLTQLGAKALDLIDQGGAAYICGANAMADGVRASMLELRSALRGDSPEDAQSWLSTLAEEGRWLVDVWASG